MARAAALCLCTSLVRGDFFYPHFNDTAALRFNGVAATSSCEDGGPYAYDPVHGTNDAPDYGETVSTTHEGTGSIEEFTVATASVAESRNTTKHEASFAHREAVRRAPDPAGCDVRLRLTPARPYKVGSVMRTERLPVLDGFETGFTFQVTDHSRACTLVKDPTFGPVSYRSCAVHGGDGFALVLHGDDAGSGAVGEGGGGLGYAGLTNALVVELDTWYNPNPPNGAGGGESDDALEDHVTVQASVGGAAGGRVTSTASSRLGHIIRAPLADGALHTVRVVYWPVIRTDLLHAFTASSTLLPFLKDGGDSRGLGTLAVYIDDGGGLGSYTPADAVLAMPINLGSVLRLPEGRAWVGFTSSTGRAWEKHDVTRWYFCEAAGCPALRGKTALLQVYYDSNQHGALPDPADEVARDEALTPAQAGEVSKYGPHAVT